MATYATADELLKQYPRLSTTGLTTGEFETNIVRAESIVDAYLASRYSVPFSPVPAIIKQVTIDIAALDLFDRCQQAAEWIVRRWQSAMDILKMLQSGDMAIPGVAVLTTIDTPTSTTKDYVPVFGVEPSLREQVDPNRIDAEDEARWP